MEFPTDVYYMMETDASGFKYSYPTLDTIPNLSKLIMREVWAHDRDSIKFELILSLYMDNTYPSDKICSKLYKRIDQHIIDGLSYDTMEEDTMLLHKNKPYLRTKVSDYKNTWCNIIKKLSQKYVCLGRKTKYTQILDTYIFVLCHCIYEDENVITYIIESGNSFHGGCGCRNIADYLTFNKSNGHLLTKEEVINGVPKSLVNEIIHSAFIGSADLKGFPVDEDSRTACFDNANGAAVVSGGLLFYYYPYTIGCGAEGQYNLLIPNLSSSIKQ